MKERGGENADAARDATQATRLLAPSASTIVAQAGTGAWWVVDGGTVWRSDDAVTWRVAGTVPRTASALAALDERTARVVSADTAFTTSDGGATWVPVRP